MEARRRSFLSVIACALLGARAAFGGLQGQGQSQGQGQWPRMPHIPGARGNDGSPEEEQPMPRDPKRQLKENEKTLRRDTDHLLQLAQDLKTEVDKTEQTVVLSLPLVRKAEEIEKLARKVKELARGT